MLRRNKHTGPRRHISGRARLLDPEKKVTLCELVAKGASLEDAAETACVSLRTVQRERKLDEDFDHELQLSLRQAPDPLKMMQHAARAHWRAAAWLLERTDPENYAKRLKTSASPAQFDAGLEFVMEAALAAIPTELHEQVYEYMAAAAEEASACLFPNYGRWGDAKRPKLPPTPLVQKQFRQWHADPKHQRVVAEHEHGNISETLPPQLPEHLQPRAPYKKPAMASPPSAVGWVDRAAATHQAPTPDALHDPSTPPPQSAPEGRRHVARGASPWTQRTMNSKPQRGDVAPVFRESRLREVRTARPITPRQPNVSRDNHPLLSPKTRFATKANVPQEAQPSAQPQPPSTPTKNHAADQTAPTSVARNADDRATRPLAQRPPATAYPAPAPARSQTAP